MSGVVDNEQFRKLLLSLPGNAIEILYHQYYSNLLRIAKSLTHDDVVAEDIVQETFVHVWENHKELGQQRDQPIRSYLIRLIKYKAIAHFREAVRLNKFRIEYLNNATLDNQPSIESRIIRAEINREVRQLVEKFPKRERECLLMKMDEGLSAEQIAERLSITEKAVERTVTSAYKRLRNRWISTM